MLFLLLHQFIVAIVFYVCYTILLLLDYNYTAQLKVYFAFVWACLAAVFAVMYAVSSAGG